MRSLIIAMSVACVGKGTDTGALEPGAEPGPGPGPGDPIDCVGLEGYMGYRSPIDDHIQRTQLAEFPLSVPTVAQLGGELWFAAQMFQDVENYCDVIGFAPLLELPSEEEHPLTPLQLDGVPELGQIPNQNGLVFPPADPTLIPIPERDIVVLLTTLRLADAPDMPCIGLSVANDTADPTAGFTYLDSALWCEAGMPMMDASGWYDPSTDSLRLFYSNFSMPGVSNWYADVDISGPPEDWIIADSGPSSFDDFNLLGNFSDGLQVFTY